MSTFGRNDPCPCGSGKKYKHCCLKREAAPVKSSAPDIQEAIAHHQAGRLPQAEFIYRRILQVEPDRADALHLLGVIAHQEEKSNIAVELITKAIAINPAVPAYYSNLGAVLQAQGKWDEATDSLRKSLSLQPDHAVAHFDLGAALQAQGKLDAATESFHRALALQPDYVEAHASLGNALKDQGKLEVAIEHYRQALALKPSYADVQFNLGAALQAQNKLDEAVACYREALLLKPDIAETHYNLGIALQAQDKPTEAISSYRAALALKPDYAEAHCNMGIALQALDKPAEAISSYRAALALKPDLAEAHCNIGFILHEQGQSGVAVAHCRQALLLKPDYMEAHYNLGNALPAVGRLDEAAEHYHKALSLKPDLADAYSNLLFLHCYHAALDPLEYLALAREWECACLPAQDRQAARQRIFRRSPLAGRRLRVGYVSGDFRQHAVSYFIERIFAHHDRARIELFAYSASRMQDAVTERLRALVDHWIPVAGMSDVATRDRIEADGIDVLIDLSGHTRYNRLGVFARRAAPVQANYLGYFASTGLTEMDYWIGDDILTPPETDSHFSEQVWRLPRVWLSYKTIADAPEPDWRPADDGSVWLGSFNNLGKLTPQTLALWARVLHALPEARLLLKTKELAEADNRQRILDALSEHGIPPHRIELQRESEWVDYMREYNRLDIALDPVGGHGGGTSTCDTLWMGVPVIHALGSCATSRFTAAMLDAIGRPEWIARSEEEYIDKVVALARDVEQRKALRFNQRERMASSPLCDAHGLARSLESAYFEMFERWLTRQNAQPPQAHGMS